MDLPIVKITRKCTISPEGKSDILNNTIFTWVSKALITLVPFSEPIKTNTNRDSLTSVSQSFMPTAWICFEFWMLHWITCPLWLAWVITLVLVLRHSATNNFSNNYCPGVVGNIYTCYISNLCFTLHALESSTKRIHDSKSSVNGTLPVKCFWVRKLTGQGFTAITKCFQFL